MTKLKRELPDEFAGFAPEQPPAEAAHAPWHDLYWRAWDALRYDRPYTAFGGELPITYTTISRYAEDHGIAGDDFGVFRTLFAAIDAEHLLMQSEKSTEDKPT